MFYVYLDMTSNGEVFYVGKGTRGRVRDTRRNKKHKRISEQYGFVRKIILETEEESHAFKCEASLICYFGTYTQSWDDDKLAANFTLGGEGCTGYNHKDDAKLAMSLARKGRAKSQEQKDKQSIAMKGRIFSEEHKKNLSLAHMGNIPGNKGKKWTSEQQAKNAGKYVEIGRRNIGQKRSKESRKNMKRAQMLRREKEKAL